MTDEAADSRSTNAEGHDAGPARALTLHLLRMFETRADAAGIALQSEMRSLSARMQLRLMAAGAMFIALWGGIVLLAIVLPPHLRVPVLGAVVAAFAIAAVWAHLAAKRKVASRDIGSMTWFLDSLRLDLEVLSRSLANTRAQATPDAAPESGPEPEQRSAPNDIAA